MGKKPAPHRIRILATTASGVLPAVGISAGSASASDARPASAQRPAACYDVLTSYSKPSGYSYFPYNGRRLTTTSRCADINADPSTTGYMAVCFHPSSGAEYRNGWTAVPANRFSVVATGVKDGTKFCLTFASTAATAGFWAA